MSSMHVFADESGTHDDAPCMAVGAFFFEKHLATAFSERWSAVLKGHRIPYFRMSDLVHKTGPFKGWDDDQALKIEIMLIETIDRHAQGGCAVSVLPNDYKDVFGRILGIDFHEDAYLYCLLNLGGQE